MIIRQETPEDFDQIYDLVKVAFQTAKVSNGQEHDFVNELRHSGNYIPELAMVAQEENGQLIGHIMLTKTYIDSNKQRFETLLIAPLSVVLEHRNQAVGSALIRKGFKLAREMGYTSAFLVGDPAYYHRFGFKTAASFGIRTTHKIPEENVMVCELVPGGLHGVSGVTECC